MSSILKQNKIHYMTYVRVDSNGLETKSSVAINNERGDLKEITFYTDTDTIKEKYSYDSNNRITKVQVSTNDRDWRLKMKNVYDDKNNRETNFEYDEKGIVYRTEYLNNSFGKNISNRFYIDDQLKSIHLFYWTDNCKLDSIVRFDADSNKTGEKLILNYNDLLLTDKTKYQDGQAIEIEKFEYNELGLQELIIYEVPNEYRQSTVIKYEGELPVSETSIYKSLTDDYTDTTRYKWKYK